MNCRRNAILDKYMVLPFAFKRDTRNHRHQASHVFLSIYSKFTIWFEKQIHGMYDPDTHEIWIYAEGRIIYPHNRMGNA